MFDEKYQLVILGDIHTRVTFWYVHRAPRLPSQQLEVGISSLLFSTSLDSFSVHKAGNLIR